MAIFRSKIFLLRRKGTLTSIPAVFIMVPIIIIIDLSRVRGRVPSVPGPRRIIAKCASVFVLILLFTGHIRSRTRSAVLRDFRSPCTR